MFSSTSVVASFVKASATIVFVGSCPRRSLPLRSSSRIRQALTPKYRVRQFDPCSAIARAASLSSRSLIGSNSIPHSSSNARMPSTICHASAAAPSSASAVLRELTVWREERHNSGAPAQLRNTPDWALVLMPA